LWALGGGAYVVNQLSNSISVIDPIFNKVVAGVKFDITPANSGFIECNKIKVPIKQYVYVFSGDKCKAKPYKGFEFISWQENLKGNSTLFVNSSASPSPWDSIMDSLGIKQEKPESIIRITKFGNFTATYKELPPPLPAEYWTTLFGFVLTTGLGAWLIPSLVRWTHTKADIRKSNYYHQRIKYFTMMVVWMKMILES